MDLTLFFKIPGLVLLSYLLGSIPWGLVLTRCFTSKNIPESGSGNIGATNVRRVAGTPLGVVTLVLDILKGSVPVLLACELVNPKGGVASQIFISVVALAAFFGHLYPIYLKFRLGGKGVATAAGCFLIISFSGTMVALLTFIFFICMTSRVSVGSLAAAAILPLAVQKATLSPVFTVCAAVTAVFIFFRHKDNIKRLSSGKEPLA